MDKIEYVKPKNTLYINAAGNNLNVFRVGASPLLAERSNSDFDAIAGTHTHFTYEIFFVTSGKLRLVTESFTKDYRNTVLIIPPKLKHCSVPSGGASYRLLFSFDKKSHAEADIKKATENGICELPLSDVVAFYIEKLTEKTAENTDSAETAAAHLASLLFIEVLSSVNPEYLEQKKEIEQRFRHISAIEDFINKNISKRITLADMSQNIHLCEKQITRVIKKEYGCNFSQLITEKRLAAACILLKDTDIKISDVASRTFYSTEAYFYTVFKNRYGISPLQYRKNTRHTENV